MKRVLLAFPIGFLVGLSIAAVRPPRLGETVIVYQTTDVQLWEDIQNAQRWEDFFILSGDYGWAAYHAGIKAHAQSQIDELYKKL